MPTLISADGIPVSHAGSGLTILHIGGAVLHRAVDVIVRAVLD